MAVDYAGEELRMAGGLSKEPVWVKAFMHDEDVHKGTAIQMFGADAYDSQKRKYAKIANFGLLFA